MEHNQPTETTLILPLQIISQNDVSRLEREVELLNDFFTQAALKAAIAKTLPQVSSSLKSLFEDNKLNILEAKDRAIVKEFITSLRSKAKVVNISFAVEPKPAALMKILAWFRQQAHPHVVLRVGLQPTIAAGCIVRTNNKYFDLSFKHQFAESKQKLSKALENIAV